MNIEIRYLKNKKIIVQTFDFGIVNIENDCLLIKQHRTGYGEPAETVFCIAVKNILFLEVK